MRNVHSLSQRRFAILPCDACGALDCVEFVIEPLDGSWNDIAGSPWVPTAVKGMDGWRRQAALCDGLPRPPMSQD